MPNTTNPDVTSSSDFTESQLKLEIKDVVDTLSSNATTATTTDTTATAASTITTNSIAITDSVATNSLTTVLNDQATDTIPDAIQPTHQELRESQTVTTNEPKTNVEKAEKLSNETDKTSKLSKNQIFKSIPPTKESSRPDEILFRHVPNVSQQLGSSDQKVSNHVQHSAVQGGWTQNASVNDVGVQRRVRQNDESFGESTESRRQRNHQTIDSVSQYPKSHSEGSFRHRPQPILPTASASMGAHRHDQSHSVRKFNVTQTPATPWIWQPRDHLPEVISSKRMADLHLEPVPNEDEPELVHYEMIAKHSPIKPAQQIEKKKKARNDDEISLELIKKLTSSEYDDIFVLRKKKIFADSSFYDDPDHKYPTIEEQIKMARKVAQSLTAPVNVAARGQNMFYRRKEKSVNWYVDSAGYHRPPSHNTDLYYNPTPWKGSSKSKSRNTIGGNFEMPSISEKTVRFNDFSKKHAGSTTQLGRERAAEGKSEFGDARHRPRIGLSGLFRKKGKGDALFAARRAQSGEETDDDIEQIKLSYSNSGGSSPGHRPMSVNLDLLLADNMTPQPGHRMTPQPGQSRLEQMIASYRKWKNPWDAGVDYYDIVSPPATGNGFRLSAAISEPNLSNSATGDRKGSSFCFLPKTNFRPVRYKPPTNHLDGAADAQQTSSSRVARNGANLSAISSILSA